MKLVSKLTIFLMVGILAVLAVDGYLTIDRELARSDLDMRSDAQLYGAALARTTAEVWSTQGEDRALDAIAEANEIDDRLTVRLVRLGTVARPGRMPAVPADRLPAPERRARSIVVHDGGDGHLHTYVPLAVEGGRAVALEIAESLRPQIEYRRATIRRIVLVVSLTALVCAVLALALGGWVVGRPIHRLVARAREIGRGDLAGSLALRRSDELGLLAAEIDAMSRSLLAAHDRAAREAAERARVEEQLRHADRLATVGTLAAGIAHEMGSPLNIVGERAAMIERREIAGEAVVKSARIIREQSARMTAIIRQLLDFARRRTTAPAPCDVAHLIGEIGELLQSYAADRAVSVAVRTRDKVVVAVDREQIQQALTNLIINAIQASPRGAAVEISIDRVSAARPDDLQAAPHDWVRISVIDHGEGIAPEDARRVFEPFFTTKDVGEGTGLGLAVAHGIVSDHRGWIGVVSAPGAGARFAIHLPEGRGP